MYKIALWIKNGKVAKTPIVKSDICLNDVFILVDEYEKKGTFVKLELEVDGK